MRKNVGSQGDYCRSSTEKLYLPPTIAACCGVFFAAYLYGQAIDPTNTSWLLFGGDMFQHFIGWHFFRSDPWVWPLGTLASYATDLNTSIVFTDSLPLLAIPLKLIEHWLPERFQYLGVVAASGIVLNAFFSCRLLLKLGFCAPNAVIAATLFLSLPILTTRGIALHAHETLTFQWLILLGIELFVFAEPFSLRRALSWLALLLTAVTVHFYLLFMVGVLWLGWWLRCAWLLRTDRSLVTWSVWSGTGLATPLLVLLLGWSIGYLQYSSEAPDRLGFGLFSAELLTFFNPLAGAWFFEHGFLPSLPGLKSVSSWFSGWPSPIPGQYEGQAYSGMGIIILWAMATCVVATQGLKPTLAGIPGNARWLFVVTATMFVLALGDRVVIGYRVFELGYPDLVSPLTALIRASGRLAWPLFYVLLLGTLVLLRSAWSRRRMFLVLLTIALLQQLDLSSYHSFIRREVRLLLECGAGAPDVPCSAPIYPVMRDLELARLWQTRDRFLAVSDIGAFSLTPFLFIAAEHGMTINIAHPARVSSETINEVTKPHREALRKGDLDPRAVYLLRDQNQLETACAFADVHCREYQGLTLAWIQD